jgi:hypothetical protein
VVGKKKAVAKATAQSVRNKQHKGLSVCYVNLFDGDESAEPAGFVTVHYSGAGKTT